jgi:flagellum-specific ATP synthase
LGRVLDALGNPIDGKEIIKIIEMYYPALASPPDPLKRQRITEQIVTGVRAIDGLLSTGKGQRLGIFGGSGVGKSNLLGMIARNNSADVNVIALIGERGAEIINFIENDLGEEGLNRSVVIATPSNSPPLARLRSAYTAIAVAEFFRDQGLDVMLLFDSLTRFARAQREIGLALGEPAVSRGYTSGTFDSIPKLLERAGTSDTGSITGFFTILVDDDDLNEPVSDVAKSVLDGHITLSRRLAHSGHYPAIDVPASSSRLALAVTEPLVNKAAQLIRQNITVYTETEDLIKVGTYRSGSNPAIDEAIVKHRLIEDFLIQTSDEHSTLELTFKAMERISGVSSIS